MLRILLRKGITIGCYRSCLVINHLAVVVIEIIPVFVVDGLEIVFLLLLLFPFFVFRDSLILIFPLEVVISVLLVFYEVRLRDFLLKGSLLLEGGLLW
jgi:hypothetical protein